MNRLFSFLSTKYEPFLLDELRQMKELILRPKNTK